MSFIASYSALWFLIGFLILVSIGLLREVTILKRSLDGLHREVPLVIGSRAPKFSALDARSGRKVTSGILQGRMSLILFISPRCSICRYLVQSLQFLFERGSFSVVAVCKGNQDDCKDFLEPLGHEAPVLLDTQAEISELYGVSGYPVAVVVDAERTVRGYGYPKDSRSLEEIVASALRDMGTNVNSSQLPTRFAQGRS